MEKLYGAMELGGTKTIVAAGRAGEKPLRTLRIPTTEPEETLDRAIAFFRDCERDGFGSQALGIGSFGPVDLDPASPRWGFVTSTPKLRWQGSDIAGTMGRALGVPVGFDTDVNAAALAEARMGAGRGLDPVLYITVGTGIGGGIFVNGKLLHGAQHPEMGHLRLERRADDTFSGTCPFHGGCLEGLASGTAIKERWGSRGEDLPPEHRAWDLEAWYLAQGVVSLVMVLSPRIVVMGGGVFQVPGLLDHVRQYARELCSGYLDNPASEYDWEAALQPPMLENPGLTGAFLLAEDAEVSIKGN